jgi:hypothetical protein
MPNHLPLHLLYQYQLETLLPNHLLQPLLYYLRLDLVNPPFHRILRQPVAPALRRLPHQIEIELESLPNPPHRLNPHSVNPTFPLH